MSKITLLKISRLKQMLYNFTFLLCSLLSPQANRIFTLCFHLGLNKFSLICLGTKMMIAIMVRDDSRNLRLLFFKMQCSSILVPQREI